MKTGIAIIAILVLALATGFTTAKDDPEPARLSSSPSESPDREGTSLTSMKDEQALKLSPLLQEMRKILIAEEATLAALYEEFERESDSRRALDIQRRIHEVKTGTEISILEVQAKAARDQGRTEDADLLEEGIEKLTNPELGRSAGEPREKRELPDRN